MKLERQEGRKKCCLKRYVLRLVLKAGCDEERMEENSRFG